MANCIEKIPENYSELYKIDLVKNKKEAILVNVLAGIVMIAMIVPIFFWWDYGIDDIFNGEKPYNTSIWSIVLILAMFAYFVVHEFTHGITMKICGCNKVKYGFKSVYAYAGSPDTYFNKKSYICIALAPVVVWGILFGLLQIFLPEGYNLFFYILQIINVSGAMGDFYCTFRILKSPADILVCDTGTDMTVYSSK